MSIGELLFPQDDPTWQRPEHAFNEYSVKYLKPGEQHCYRMVTHASTLYEAVENATLSLGSDYEIISVRKEGA